MPLSSKANDVGIIGFHQADSIEGEVSDVVVESG